MLQNIRKYSNNFLIKLLLGLLIISFLVWGIGDILRSASKDYVAVIDGDQYISVVDFVEAKKKQLQQLRTVYPNISPEQIKALNLNNSILSQLITNRLLEIEAENLGILIDDSIVLNIITKNQAFFGENGKFDQGLFKKILAYNNIPESDYVSQLKNELAVKMLTESLSAQIIPSNKLIDAVSTYNRQKATVDLIAIQTSALAAHKPSDKEIEDYYQQNTAKFTLPEYRDLAYITISPKTYQGKIQVSEQELQEELNQHLADSSGNQKIFDYYDVIFDTEDDAKQALAKIRDGSNFAKEIKKSTGEDQKEYMVTAQNSANISDNIRIILDGLRSGEVSDVIKSDIGYHLIKLIKTHIAKIDVAHLKQEVRQQLKAQKIEEIMYNEIKSIEDDIASGKTLDEISKQYNMPISRVEMIDASGLNKQAVKHANHPDFNNFTIEAFKLPELQASEMLNIDESKPGYYIVSTSKIYPEKPLSIAQVRAEIISTLTKAGRASLATKTAEELLVKVGDKDFASILKSHGAKVSSQSLELARPNESESYKPNSLIPLPAQLEIFKLKPGQTSRIFQTTRGDFAFVIFKGLKTTKAAPGNDEEINLKRGLAYSLSSGLMQDYLMYLEHKYKVTIHTEVIEMIED